MSWLSRLGRAWDAFQRKEAPPMEIITPGTVDAFGRTRAPSPAGLLRECRGAVYACAMLNATALAAVPLRLYVATAAGEPRAKCPARPLSAAKRAWLRRQGGVAADARIEEVTDHPLLTLLETVNDVHGRYDLFELTDLCQELLGVAYWRIERDALARPAKVWLLPAQYVTPVHDEDGARVVGYDYAAGAARERLDPAEMIAFRFPDPRNPYSGGLSPARAVWESIDILRRHKAHVGAMLDNRARPDALVRPKGVDSQFGTAEVARFQQMFRRLFRRAGAGGVAVFPHPLEVTPLTIPPKDLEMLAQYKVSKTEIANAYGVPEAMLELSKSRAELEAALLQHARRAILPRCKRLEDRLNQSLCPRYDKRLFLKFDNPVPEDDRQAAEVRRLNLDAGVTTVNEERAAMGLPPVAGGDRPLVPSGRVPLGSATAGGEA